MQLDATLIPADGEAFSVPVVDLSVGGCGLKTGSSLHEGQILSIDLHLIPDETPLRIESAIVRAAQPERAGLEFLSIDGSIHVRDMKRSVLQLYLDNRTSK